MPGWRARPDRDHDDVGARGVRVVVGAHDLHVVAHDRGGFRHVQRLALGQALDDVDEHHVRQPGLRDALRGGRADVAGADDGDLGMGHGSWVSFERMVWARRAGAGCHSIGARDSSGPGRQYGRDAHRRQREVPARSG